ncbi:MAG: HEAT repeat domain-containing protein, partial [Phycisphaerae bacterium]|nr:HEAT repeat domain-containing protein [Phycisphaerae bacterium]
MDEQREEQIHEEHAWVRKRFAEIALHILSQDDDRDEATKSDVIKLLTPRFIDQGAANEEQAAARAELFLDRQELRSGLLVSRRAQSYRFVHLTFQEYLAAWQLSNMDFDDVAAIVQSRLRQAKWFETLQLLGGQWAKDSDEKADRYISWLLDNRGTTTNDQAPVVALCANIVKDISGVAEFRPQTRLTFKKAVEETLDAFREGSGIPQEIQLEILEALGQLGAAVKSHLIDATKASLFQVRRRAIEMLLPHLSDDELFGLDYILSDRSREPIRTYILSLLDRDLNRLMAWLDQKTTFPHKAAAAIYSVLPRIARHHSSETTLRLVNHCRRLAGWVEAGVLNLLVRKCPGESTRDVLNWTAVHDNLGLDRHVAILRLAENWPDDTTRKLLEERAVQDEYYEARAAALKALAKNWPDEITRKLLAERAVQDEHEDPRSAALQALVEKWPDEITRKLLAERAVQDEHEDPRSAALQALAEKWPDETTR